jgi:hypothetical protein
MEAALQVVILPSLYPDRVDYASFADFRHPDGKAWVLQERDHSQPDDDIDPGGSG